MCIIHILRDLEIHFYWAERIAYLYPNIIFFFFFIVNKTNACIYIVVSEWVLFNAKCTFFSTYTRPAYSVAYLYDTTVHIALLYRTNGMFENRMHAQINVTLSLRVTKQRTILRLYHCNPWPRVWIWKPKYLWWDSNVRQVWMKMFEDTKKVIRNHQLKDRQHNDQKKKEQTTIY